jgi:hypothetical protein
MSSPAGSPFLVALRVRPMLPRYVLAPEAFALQHRCKDAWAGSGTKRQSRSLRC